MTTLNTQIIELKQVVKDKEQEVKDLEAQAVEGRLNCQSLEKELG